MQQFDFPRERTGDLRADLDRLWHDYWSCVEKLRLLTEEMEGLGRQIAGAADKAQTNQTAAKLPENLLAARIPFGMVTSNSTTVFEATVPGITKLEDGVCAYIRNNNKQTSASGWSLNVNGLGAKPVYNTMQDNTLVTTTFNKGYTMLFVYNTTRDNGAGWDMYYGYNSNDNTLAYNVRTYQTDRTTLDRLPRYQFVFTTRDGHIFPSYTLASGNAGTGTSKTLNTSRSFDPFMPIFYYGSTTNVPANSQPSGSVLWRQYYACEMRYAWNTGTTLQAVKPCYIRCTPNADGTVQLDGNNCLVQTLPNSEDGKVYIYLGMAYGSNGYNMELEPEHPVFEYKSGQLQRWYG